MGFSTQNIFGYSSRCILLCYVGLARSLIFLGLTLGFGCKEASTDSSVLIRGGRDVTLVSDPVAKTTVGIGGATSDDLWCSGAILTKKWVVTGAHCWLAASPTHVFFGPKPGQSIAIGAYTRHQKFNPNNPILLGESRHWDIALIQLARPAPMQMEP